MVDFYTVDEPAPKHEHKHDPIHGLELTMAQYYSTLLSKIINHVNNNDVHVTAEEKESWNNKADKSTVDDLKLMVEDHEDKLGDLDSTITLIVKNYITDTALDSTILNNYATIKYVNDQIAKISGGNLVDYAEKSWVNQNFVKIGSTTTFDASKYYTKSEIDKIISTGISYAITDFSFRDGKLSIVQENGINTSINIGSGTDSGVTIDYLNSALSGYIPKGNLGHITFVKGTQEVLTWGPEDGDARIYISGSSGGSGGGADGGTYTPYFYIYTSAVSLPQDKWPDLGLDPTKKGWVKNIASNPSKGQYVWMTQVLITAGVFGLFTTPFCITGPEGEAGVDTNGKEFIYKRTKQQIQPIAPVGDFDWGASDFGEWTDNPQGVDEEYTCEWLLYRTMDENGKISEWYPRKDNSPYPVLWSHYGHNGTDGDGVEYIFASLKPDEQYSVVFAEDGGNYPPSWPVMQTPEYFGPDNTRWTDDPIDISTAAGYGQGSRTYVSTRKKRVPDTDSSEGTEAVYTAYSEPALWSYMAKDSSTGEQSLKGSPLRDRGEWDASTKYYDGYTETDSNDHVFWQDIVTRKHTITTDSGSQEITDRYVCIKVNTGNDPLTSEAYWNKLTDVGPIYTDVLQATKAYINELTAEEVIITDGSTVVAGMTSSEGGKSTLTGQGDVRIWAGTNGSNIANAPFTVTNTGAVTSRGDNGVIRIENGVIYFIINGNTWYLGIDSSTGKPNWLGGGAADSVITHYSLSGTTFTPVKTQLGIKDGKYYTDATLPSLCNGEYYFAASQTAYCVYNAPNYAILTGVNVANANFFIKSTITNGVRNDQGIVAVANQLSLYTLPNNGSGKLNVGDPAWMKITKINPSSYITSIGIVNNTQADYTTVDSSRVSLDPTATDGVYAISLASTSQQYLNTDMKYATWMEENTDADDLGKYVISNVSK